MENWNNWTKIKPNVVNNRTIHISIEPNIKTEPNGLVHAV